MENESAGQLPAVLRAFLHSCVDSIEQVELIVMLRGSQRGRTAREVTETLRVPTAAGRRHLKFWQQSRDRLFLRFAYAFWMLALSYTLLGLLASATEWRVSIFVVRLLAFCMIVYGIVEKNRA